ncbi:CLUMA_CG005939, isoform A [Clunio marinus]|uniref:CLUMA_CG005939, isoform A n=1 Tax=Clunio marinus TaxID=568069 RepID=A0A1J1HWK5_9DIPT|nr:CLUMA_CG005939, isoform A [Clunio marinus]
MLHYLSNEKPLVMVVINNARFSLSLKPLKFAEIMVLLTRLISRRLFQISGISFLYTHKTISSFLAKMKLQISEVETLILMYLMLLFKINAFPLSSEANSVLQLFSSEFLNNMARHEIVRKVCS